MPTGEILMPVRTAHPIDWTGVPSGYRLPEPRVSAVVRSVAEAGELVHYFGGQAGFCPLDPILLMVPGPDQTHMILVQGLGFAGAAELQDLCVVSFQRALDRLARTGSIMDFAKMREDEGWLPQDQVQQALGNALHDRMARHRASPRSDPPREAMQSLIHGGIYDMASPPVGASKRPEEEADA